MKKNLFPFIAFFVLLVVNTNAQNDKETFKAFVSSISALQGESIYSISGLSAAAEKKATKTIVITAANIKEALADAKGKSCILVVGNHTFVKFSDTKNCSTSGSWGACMPYGEGYVKKGMLTESKGYINTIVGKPDDQIRTLYIF